jgi:hypothetical protein
MDGPPGRSHGKRPPRSVLDEEGTGAMARGSGRSRPNPRGTIPPEVRERTLLRRAEPTEAGRRIFGLLSEASPGIERLRGTHEPSEGEWQGEAFLARLHAVGNKVRFPGLEKLLAYPDDEDLEDGDWDDEE